MSWNTNELANTLRAQMASHPPVIVVKEKCMEDKTYYMDVGFFNTLENVGGAMLSRQYKDPPIVNVTYQKCTGALMASGYSKLGTQEAMNDMYVTQNNWDGAQTAPTLTVNNASGSQRMPDKENFNAIIGGGGTETETIVRRLTPLECERLQGFPDDWTDIGEWVDSKGKKHKEADSPRYKALGNSIALPFWEWMAKRMVKQLGKEKPTMGSLFDGIGGFGLAYQRAGCEPVWASEIEEFCIAVTKKHFPEGEEKGVENE